MTKRHGRAFRLYFDHYNLSGLASKFARKVKVDTVDVTNFASAGDKEYLEGPYDWTGDWTGFFEDTDDGWDEQSFAMIAAGGSHYCGQVVCADPDAGAAAGDLAWEDVCIWTDQPRDFDIGGALVLSGGLQGRGGTARGDPGVNYAGAVTATGTQTGVNHGVTTSTQAVVVTYRILSVSGSGSIAIACEQSSDNGSGDAYAAIADLASGTLTGVGVTRKTYTGATEAWKRLNVTTFSGFTSVTLLVTITVKA